MAQVQAVRFLKPVSQSGGPGKVGPRGSVVKSGGMMYPAGTILRDPPQWALDYATQKTKTSDGKQIAELVLVDENEDVEVEIPQVKPSASVEL